MQIHIEKANNLAETSRLEKVFPMNLIQVFRWRECPFELKKINLETLEYENFNLKQRVGLEIPTSKRFLVKYILWIVLLLYIHQNLLDSTHRQ